jgi:hypothetical protein
VSTERFGEGLPELIDDTQRQLKQLRYTAASNEIFRMDLQVTDFEIGPYRIFRFPDGEA